MNHLDTLWTEVQPHLSRLSREEQKSIIAAFDHARETASRPGSKKQGAARGSSVVHPVPGKTSDDPLQRYQTLFEISGTAMVVIEHDGMILLTNTPFLNLLGYTREEVENRKNFLTFFTEHFRNQVNDYHLQMRAGNTTVPHHYEAQVTTSAGEILDVIIMIGMFPGTSQSVVSIIDITDRKRMEDELKLFKTSAERAYDEVFWLDFEGNMLYVNDAACRNTGYSREELLSMKVFKLDPDFNPDIWDGFTRNLRKNKTLIFETRHKRKDGSIMDVEIATNYVTREGSEFSFAFVRDITKRKQAEEELRLFKASVDRANDEIFWFDFDGNILYVNESSMQKTGYSQEELLAMTIFKLNPHINPDIWAGFITTLRKDGSLRTESRHRRKNGEIMDVEIVANYVTKDSSEYSIAFVRDITERKRAQDELSAAHAQLIATEQELRQQFDKLAASRVLLEESEAKFHGVFNYANDGIFLHIIKDGVPDRFLEVNDSMCSALGYTREELLTMTVKDILSEDQLKAMPEIGKTLSERGYNTFYAEYRRKDGTTAPVEVNSRIFQFSGRVVVLSVARDITERKRAEQELIKKNDELEAAYEQMAAVEQELRTNYENLSATEKKLRESEAWSREFTELLPQFIYEIDKTGKFLFVNQLAADVFGVTRDILDGGLNIKDIVVPEEWDMVERNHDQILAGNKPLYTTYHLRCKDGTIMPANIYSVPVYHDGVLMGFRGILVDITETLRVQETLQKSESRFRELAELLPQIVFELDEKLEFTFFNWNTVEMTGFAYHDLSQSRKSIFTILQESDRKPVEQFFTTILKKSASDHIGCVMLTQEGKEIPAIIYASPIISENRVTGIRGVIVDISEQKVLETALRESESRFRELAELVPQFIFETDRNFRFSYFNLGAMTVTGYSYDDFTKGIDVFSLVGIADRPQLRESFQRILGGLGIPPLQLPLRRKDGEILPVILYASPIVRGNEYEGVRGIIVDIADQKRLETALATTNQKLNLMNSLTRHDVLNNITGLLGLVDMMGELTSDNNAQVMLSEIRGLIITIKDQIIFTRDYQDVGVKAPQWQSLRQSIQYASSTTALDRVILKLPETDAEIYADPFFGRVFYNLIDNSLRHGGSVRDILIETETAKDGSLIIRYHDDGIGVPPDEKELIFKQGFGKNTGFGLFIIREILGITGMTIRETGTFRSGVIFEITVPKVSWRRCSGHEQAEKASEISQGSGQVNAQ